MHVFRKATTALLAGILGFSGSLPATDFLRGDADGSGRLAVSDAIRILVHLFQGDPNAVPCADAADADDSGAIDLADAVHLLSGLFLGGPAPATPFPACGEDPTEDALGCEEACPPAIAYFGKEFREDGVFFLIDTSSAMHESLWLIRAKRETERLVQDLPSNVEFAVVFFGDDVKAFPADGHPAKSTDEGKVAALAFIRGVPPTSSTCGLAGLLRGLEFARNSRGRSPALFYVSDGGGTCHGADEPPYLQRILETVTVANAGLARIHSFQAPLARRPQFYKSFLEQLAFRNGGTFSQLPPP